MNISWLAIHQHQIPNFLTETNFYAEPLANVLRLNFPFEDIDYCKSSYKIVRKFLRSRENSEEEKEAILSSFSIAMLYYFVNEKLCRYELSSSVTEKGLIITPLAVNNINGFTEKSSIISAVYNAVFFYNMKDGFEAFCIYALNRRI